MGKVLGLEALSGIKEWVNSKDNSLRTELQAQIGSPLVASTVAGMTDHTKVYVYTGSETGYTAGNWYYYNGSAWTSGGVYNSTAFETDTTLTIAGMAADAKATGDEITHVKQDINEFTAIENEKIPYVYQYLDVSKRTQGYFYNLVNGAIVPVAHSTFNIYSPIYLLPGTYTILGTIYAAQSYVDNGSEIKAFSAYFSTSSAYTGDFTIEEDITLYVTINKDVNAQVRIINKSSLSGFTVPYTAGLFYGKINPHIDANDTSYCDQAFIKNGELRCNNDHLNASTSVGKYTQVEMGGTVKKIMCSGYFQDISNVGATITLIATANNTYTNVQNITKGSLHINFGTSGVDVQVFVDNALTTVERFTYAIQANQEIEIGWSISGNTITVYLPDGTTQTVTDSRFANLNGKYMIFEHFRYLNTATEPPTDFGLPVITGIYCECENGKKLIDNFKRPNGAPCVAPTGQLYYQFRNASPNDGLFDNVGNTLP